MRGAYAVLLAFLAGVFIAFVDLRGALLSYSAGLADILYYIGLDMLVILVAFLLTIDEKRAWWRNLLLFASAFFGIEALWNFVYGGVAYYTGTLRFPLNLGLGQYVNADQYYIGILVQLFLSFLFYIVYRVTSST